MSRLFRITLGSMTILLGGLVFWTTNTPRPNIPVVTDAPTTAAPNAPASSPTQLSPSPKIDEPNKTEPDSGKAHSPLALELNAETSTGAQDVNTLHTLLRQYSRRLQRRQGLPIGNDMDLARVLSGENPMKYAALPKDHPALGAGGHLCDRWGTPYFVHPTGPGAFEIRSAGPDRTLFTDDDLIADPSGESE